ncbi:IS66 family insertion sequence element accessory protein TnpB [Sphingobium sp. CR2-8]|uniref:IS66 family insertion sequence element accessory protein TnpB n=1 Tax=Sphingobium sp. CR2-8 TaxID=1306534 RepID=UPI003FA36A5A
MIPVPSGVRIWIATGQTDMRRGMRSLALQVQQSFGCDPFAGDLYIFRGRRGDLCKIIWCVFRKSRTAASLNPGQALQ